MKNRQNDVELTKVVSGTSPTDAVESPSTKSSTSTGGSNGGKPPIHSNFKRETSPTSVVLHPQAAKKPPRVMMGDEGAEVSLNTPPPSRKPLTDQTNILVTPNRRVVHMNSLLDVDISPDASENKEPPLSASNIFCGSGGSGCLDQNDADGCELTNTPQASIERTITLLLSDPSALDGWCNAWQAWFFFGQNHDENTRETKEDMKRVLRNRAYDLNSRSRRIRTLKEDLSPFDVTPAQVSATIPLTKTRSFPGRLGENIPCRSTERRSSSASSDTSLNISVASFWESMPGCGQPDSDSPAVIRSMDLAKDDLYYDSDPEEMTRDRSQSDTDTSTFVSFIGSEKDLGGTEKSIANRKTGLAAPRRLEAIFNNDDHAKTLVQVSATTEDISITR